jgi:signal transduction histidine kinase
VSSPDTRPSAPADEALLRRVQQDNQREVLGKLLHDLRNPVHSIRISMELFGRLARRRGDVDKLLERAGTFIGPAENALESLLANTDKLGRYLGAPAPVSIAAFPAGELLREIAALLKASRRNLQVTCPPSEAAEIAVAADRVRVAHVLLHSCLNGPSLSITLSVREESTERARIEVTFEPMVPSATDPGPRATALTADEVEILVKAAGGTVQAGAASGMSLGFNRAPTPASG